MLNLSILNQLLKQHKSENFFIFFSISSSKKIGFSWQIHAVYNKFMIYETATTLVLQNSNFSFFLEKSSKMYK